MDDPQIQLAKTLAKIRLVADELRKYADEIEEQMGGEKWRNEQLWRKGSPGSSSIDSTSNKYGADGGWIHVDGA